MLSILALTILILSINTLKVANINETAFIIPGITNNISPFQLASELEEENTRIYLLKV